ADGATTDLHARLDLRQPNRSPVRADVAGGADAVWLPERAGRVPPKLALRPVADAGSCPVEGRRQVRRRANARRGFRLAHGGPGGLATGHQRPTQATRNRPTTYH